MEQLRALEADMLPPWKASCCPTCRKLCWRAARYFFRGRHGRSSETALAWHPPRRPRRGGWGATALWRFNSPCPTSLLDHRQQHCLRSSV